MTTSTDHPPVPACYPPDLWDTLEFAVFGRWSISRYGEFGWAAVPLGRRLDLQMDPVFPTARAAAEALQAYLSGEDFID